MSFIKQPFEIPDAKKIRGLLYGQPGIGKTTLALSAPNPVLIDSDLGVHRVAQRHRTAYAPLSSYADLKKALNEGALDPFDTVVFDTLGALVERIADSIAADPALKASKRDGGLSLPGFGLLRREFANLLGHRALIEKHLIFVAHESEAREDDQRVLRPDVMGSSGKDLVKHMDFVGYMEMRNGARTISLTPSERYYAKNSIGLNGLLTIPDTDTAANDFIARVIVGGAEARREAEADLTQKYRQQIEDGKRCIEALERPEELTEAIQGVCGQEGLLWDAQARLKAALMERAKKLGATFDKARKAFVGKGEEGKADE